MYIQYDKPEDWSEKDWSKLPEVEKEALHLKRAALSFGLDFTLITSRKTRQRNLNALREGNVTYESFKDTCEKLISLSDLRMNGEATLQACSAERREFLKTVDNSSVSQDSRNSIEKHAKELNITMVEYHAICEDLKVTLLTQEMVNMYRENQELKHEVQILRNSNISRNASQNSVAYLQNKLRDNSQRHPVNVKVNKFDPTRRRKGIWQ